MRASQPSCMTAATKNALARVAATKPPRYSAIESACCVANKTANPADAATPANVELGPRSDGRRNHQKAKAAPTSNPDDRDNVPR